MKWFLYVIANILIAITLIIVSCGTTKNRPPRKVVPVAISINTREPQLNSVNLNLFSFKVIDRLDDFGSVELERVEERDSAEIIIDIDIVSFNSLPAEQRVSRRVFRRNVQAGTDQNGRAIYQTISASADLVQSRIRTRATFNTRLQIKGVPGKKVERTFNENLNLDQVYVTNIQGDPRAVDPSVYSYTMPPMQPLTDDVLLTLANREMLDRLSREIRYYYQNGK